MLLLFLAMPGLWTLGLDQLAWPAIGITAGVFALRSERWAPLPLLMVGFLAVVVISGVLGAQGTRWITLARELVIAVAFFAALLGSRVFAGERRSSFLLCGGLAFVVAVSSVGSLVAAVLQNAATFETVIGPLIPDVIASTRLGELSFVERSLGTFSFFLGQFFLRPHGLFLFSTSQAVAYTAAIPLMLAAAAWFPRHRWWFRAVAVLSLVAMLATTTRVPIIGLGFSFLVVWLARRWMAGTLVAGLPFTLRALPAYGVALAIVLAVLLLSGMADIGSQLLATRSLDPRVALYDETLRRWLERPLIGWGTEVDWDPSASSEISVQEIDPAAIPPLGSHSHYLGMLFKQGLIGLALFAGIIVVVARGAARRFTERRPGGDLLVVAFLATLIAGLTESWWLDPAGAVIVAVAWGYVSAPSIAADTARDSTV